MTCLDDDASRWCDRSSGSATIPGRHRTWFDVTLLLTWPRAPQALSKRVPGTHRSDIVALKRCATRLAFPSEDQQSLRALWCGLSDRTVRARNGPPHTPVEVLCQGHMLRLDDQLLALRLAAVLSAFDDLPEVIRGLPMARRVRPPDPLRWPTSGATCASPARSHALGAIIPMIECIAVEPFLATRPDERSTPWALQLIIVQGRRQLVTFQAKPLGLPAP